jgi:hypothetical protein
MGCTYVKEFDFSKKTAGEKFSMGGAVKGYAEGGSVKADMKQDKAMAKTAVHKHEKALHKGEPMTKLAKGGKVPKMETMDKREMAMTPNMRRDAMMASRKVEAPMRRSVPVAPREPMIAMKHGGMAKMAMGGGVHKMPDGSMMADKMKHGGMAKMKHGGTTKMAHGGKIGKC